MAAKVPFNHGQNVVNVVDVRSEEGQALSNTGDANPAPYIEGDNWPRQPSAKRL